MGSVQLTLPEHWQGKAVHLYGFAVDYESSVRDTVYIGMLEEKAYKMPMRHEELNGMSARPTPLAYKPAPFAGFAISS